MAGLLASPRVNAYTIERRGVHKVIYQAPWFEAGAFDGLVELTLEVPATMPHFADISLRLRLPHGPVPPRYARYHVPLGRHRRFRRGLTRYWAGESPALRTTVGLGDRPREDAGKRMSFPRLDNHMFVETPARTSPNAKSLRFLRLSEPRIQGDL